MNLDLVEATAVAAAEADGAAPLDEATWRSLRGGDEGWSAVVTRQGFALTHGEDLHLVVHPDHRGRGLGAGFLADVEGPAQSWSHGGHPAAATLAARFGFRRARNLWVMRRPAAEPLPPPRPSPDVDVRTYTDADAALCSEPLDFVGVNYYSRSVVQASPGAQPDGVVRVRQSRASHTTMDWEVYPAGLTEALLWTTERYGRIPLYVTENGSAFYDPPQPVDGRVEDPLRVDYLRRHLAAVADAVAAGADVRGYFAWSLFDNFEWAAGYSKRFGLVHVDYETQARTPKTSARVYADAIRTNGASL